MNYGELLSSFLVDLQSFFRKNISIPGASYQQILGISVIPINGITMTEMSNKIGVDNSTLTRLVNGLEKKKWLARRQSSEDGRLIEVFLTDDGEKIQQSLNRQFLKYGEMIEQNIKGSLSQEVIEKTSLLHWEIIKLGLSSKKIV